ncbi:6-bladed beta-propeller [Parabacteroides sp. OttesenSCG-928-G07]|nr:6-bladed beta-propeller [Parabacteroides sp. OttesenSCG-928-G21]MDL2278344.1 6-bladed beta-propeller [Parabacteroides sp. OttesenSCG-928-G07]
MKRAFTYISLLLLILYAQYGYDVYQKSLSAAEIKGVLSEITNEITSIPLQPADGHKITNLHSIRQQGGYLYFLSNKTLYQYTTKGTFVRRITHPEYTPVAGYAINPAGQELIVLSENQHILYYSMHGELKEQREIHSSLDDVQITSFTLLNESIYLIEEGIDNSNPSEGAVIRQQIVCYDRNLEHKYEQAIINANIGRPRWMFTGLQTTLYADQDSGLMYAYRPGMNTNYLLQDTLFLRDNWQSLLVEAHKNKTIPAIPLQLGQRFWISSFADNRNEAGSYTFCYDKKRNCYWQAEGGFSDDYFQTGIINHMEPIDNYGQQYAFTKSGETLKGAFPQEAASDTTVVFIFTLKA